jgi:hypothetical protein
LKKLHGKRLAVDVATVAAIIALVLANSPIQPWIWFILLPLGLVALVLEILAWKMLFEET